MAGRFWAEKYSFFASEQDARIFYDELVVMLLKQMAAPNSPQWFNTGLNWAYGITGPSQGHFFVDYQKLTISSKYFFILNLFNEISIHP